MRRNFGKVKVNVTVNDVGVPVSVVPIEGEKRLFAAVQSAVLKFRFRVDSSNPRDRVFQFTMNVPPER